MCVQVQPGAGDRDRTGTVFLLRDFKSRASANSATPAGFVPLAAAGWAERAPNQFLYYNIPGGKFQYKSHTLHGNQF